MTSKVRIGAVSYLNTIPLVHGMGQGLGGERIDLSFATPAELAERMARRTLDVALLPIIELARMPDLQLVPGLGIVTHGPSRSVLLVSKRPVEQIESVAADPESRTSNALARVLLATVWQRRPTVRTGDVDLERALAECDATVRIGDKALFEPLPPEVESHDLGAVWSEAKGLPFVFAAWAARPGIVDRELYRVLHESLRRGSEVVERIARDYTWRGRHYPEIALEYLTRHIRFRLGPTEIRAIEVFLNEARTIGVIDEVPEIRLVGQHRVSRRDTVERIAGVNAEQGPS